MAGKRLQFSKTITYYNPPLTYSAQIQTSVMPGIPALSSQPKSELMVYNQYEY